MTEQEHLHIVLALTVGMWLGILLQVWLGVWDWLFILSPHTYPPIWHWGA